MVSTPQKTLRGRGVMMTVVLAGAAYVSSALTEELQLVRWYDAERGWHEKGKGESAQRHVQRILDSRGGLALIVAQRTRKRRGASTERLVHVAQDVVRLDDHLHVLYTCENLTNRETLF